MRGRSIRQGVITSGLLLVAFWLGGLIWGLASKAEVAMMEAKEVQGQYEALEARRQKLQANVAALETDLGKDAAIRTAFGVARPGEEVIVVVPPAPATTTPNKTWWQKVRDWF